MLETLEDKRRERRPSTRRNDQGPCLSAFAMSIGAARECSIANLWRKQTEKLRLRSRVVRVLRSTSSSNETRSGKREPSRLQRPRQARPCRRSQEHLIVVSKKNFPCCRNRAARSRRFKSVCARWLLHTALLWIFFSGKLAYNRSILSPLQGRGLTLRSAFRRSVVVTQAPCEREKVAIQRVILRLVVGHGVPLPNEWRKLQE